MGRELPVLAPGTLGGAGIPGDAGANAAPVGDPEPDDPMELVAVPVPVDAATFDEMARCLVEEYVRDGWTDERLVTLFRSPFYAGLHVIWRLRGEVWVREEITTARRRWRRPDPATGPRPDPAAGPRPGQSAAPTPPGGSA